VLKFTDPLRGDLALKVGEEYVLCHVGDRWWCAEETIDEIRAGLAERSSVGLTRTDRVEFAGAGEQRFKVVEWVLSDRAFGMLMEETLKLRDLDMSNRQG
jgi:hypothetical protein